MTVGSAAASCSPPVSSERSRRSDGLTVAPVDGGVFCDGTPREAATISGAAPNETIEFSSPMPIDVAEATADESGTVVLTWSCDQPESELTWEITATGTESGRTVPFTVSGSDRDPVLDRILIHEPVGDSVTCDDVTHTAGRLGNAVANERIDFTSPDSRSISPTLAGPDGRLDVLWTCSPADDGRQWAVTATGASSGRTVDFTITGRAPQPDDPGDIVVSVVEDPFVCDRGRRAVARLSNLTPNAELVFNVTPADDPLRSGQAGADGSLTVFWQCSRRDDGTTWELTATEQTPAKRSISFTFGSTTLDNPVTVEMTEGSFVCDGATRQAAVLRNFVANESIGFESPQSEAIRSGLADAGGSLPVRWSCRPDQVGTIWEITATGATSGASVAFTITGVAP